MSIDKCTSIILSASPFRESSLLLYLFTREHGRLHAIAKGIRRGDRRSVPIERGYLIEHNTYIKPNRDLHLATDFNIREHFPAIRGNLEKTAVRDVLFDLMLGAVRLTDPHPELFDYIGAFLVKLENIQCRGGRLLLFLSKTLFGIAGHLGVGIDFKVCSGCGERFEESTDVWLIIEKGAVRCGECIKGHPNTHRHLPAGTAFFFGNFDNQCQNQTPNLTNKQSMGVLHTACEYLRYHLDIRRRFESVAFIEKFFS